MGRDEWLLADASRLRHGSEFVSLATVKKRLCDDAESVSMKKRRLSAAFTHRAKQQRQFVSLGHVLYATAQRPVCGELYDGDA